MVLTIALSKGRIFEETLPLLAAAGIVPAGDPGASRRLILATNRAGVRIVLVRATDVPTYVQYGAADLGIAGKDVLLEHGGAGLYQPLDLGIARCRMMVAVAAGLSMIAYELVEIWVVGLSLVEYGPGEPVAWLQVAFLAVGALTAAAGLSLWHATEPDRERLSQWLAKAHAHVTSLPAKKKKPAPAKKAAARKK